jgi:asparagine synthase (glutamine-hydrolysing)
MFAIGAYNKLENCLFIARDSVGIKPLFYSQEKGSTWFASEFKQLVNANEVKHLSENRAAVRDMLQFGYMHAPNTIYHEIKQLLPGEYIKILGQGENKHVRYKHLSKYHESEKYNDSEKEVITRFQDLFAKVIDDQTVADVPLNAFLSSGIDSTLVNAFLSSDRKKTISSFTFSAPGQKGDEGSKASEYSKYLGINNEQITLESGEHINFLDNIIERLGEPFSDTSTIPMYALCKASRLKSTVMLSGDGGDELFWGYDRMFRFSNDYPFFNGSIISRKIRRKIPVFKKPTGNAVFEYISPEEMVLNGQSNIFNNVMNDLMPDSSITNELKELYTFEGQNQKEFRNWIRYNEFYGHLQRVLVKVDRMSMANSLEVRVPILDQRIVDFAWSLDSQFGLNGKRELKPFLKKVLYNYISKDKLDLNKNGFFTPINSWLNNELKAEILDLVHSKEIYRGVLDSEYLIEFVKGYFDEKKHSDRAIWSIYSFLKWKSL